MVVARSARSRGLPSGLPLKAALFNEGGLAALWPWIWANPADGRKSRVIAVEASYRTIEAALKAEIERLRP
jgi:hypothetical protein